MKLAVFNSLPEALMYILLLLVLIGGIIADVQIREILNQDKQDTMQLQKQINCISIYFNTQGRNGNTILSSLNGCNGVK